MAKKSSALSPPGKLRRVKPDAITLTEQAANELAALADRSIDVSDPNIPEITDWQTAQRGRFYRPAVHKPDVRSIRQTSGLSQSQFAQALGIGIKTLQNWEQHRANPAGPACTLLRLVERHPQTLDWLKNDSA